MDSILECGDAAVAQNIRLPLDSEIVYLLALVKAKRACEALRLWETRRVINQNINWECCRVKILCTLGRMHAAEENAEPLVAKRATELAPYFIKGYSRHEPNAANTSRINHWIDTWASGIAVHKLSNAISQFQGTARTLIEQRLNVGKAPLDKKLPKTASGPSDKVDLSGSDWAGKLAEKLAAEPNALLARATIARLTQESLEPEYADALVSSDYVQTSPGIKKALKPYFASGDFDGAVQFLIRLSARGLEIPSKHYSIVFWNTLKRRQFDTAARLLTQMREHVDASTLHIFWLHLLRAQGTSVDEFLELLAKIVPTDFDELSVPPANVAIETFELLASYAAAGLMRITESSNVLAQRRLYLNSLYDKIISSDDVYLSSSRNVIVVIISALLFADYGLVVRVLRDATSQFGCASFKPHEAHVIWTALDLKTASSLSSSTCSSPYELAQLIVEQKCPEFQGILA